MKRLLALFAFLVFFLVATWLPGTALAIQSDSGGGSSLLAGQINHVDGSGLIHRAAVPGGDLVANNEKGSSIAPMSFAEKVGNYIWPGLFAALDNKSKTGIGRASPGVAFVALE